ncbi:MAG: protein kinase [Myxococcales bacterium]|nr:protein kinase [Myxococcales bacterium]
MAARRRGDGSEALGREDPDAADTLSDDDGELAGEALEGLETVDPSHYVVGGEMAPGGMGLVRRAHDRRARRDVVLKELQQVTPRSRTRFEREARITAQLQHPSIVPVYEVGQWPDGRPFYAMKLVAGRPLDVVVEEALDASARLALVPRILPAVEAIAYAHEKGIIHRDLKPANVLLGEFGETVVIDWGLARAIDERGEAPETLPEAPTAEVEALQGGGRVTVDGAVVGTPAYMPPEQAAGQRVDARADVYALGALLYHALAGAPPFDGPSPRHVLVAVLMQPPVPLAERAPGVPRDLSSIVDKAMARQKEDRYADARELARDLSAFTRGRLVGAYDYSSWELFTRFVRRNRALSFSVVALLLTAVVGGVAVVRAQRRSERERERAVEAEQAAVEAERVAVEAERTAHARLAQVYWREAVRRLQSGDHLGAEVLAAASLREQPASPASPYHALAGSDAAPRERAALLAGPSATWSAATALRFASRTREIGEHADWVYDVLPSPDGAWIVTAGADGRVLVWDAREGRLHRSLSGHEGTVFQVALRADGRELATSGYDGTVRLWSFPEGELRRVIDHPADRVYGICYAGDRLLAAGAGAFAAYDAHTGDLVSELEAAESVPWRLRCHPDDGVAVLSTSAARAVVLDLDPLAVRHVISHRGAVVRCASRSADGRSLITADREGVMRRFDLATGALEAEATIGQGCESMAVSPDGDVIAVGSRVITIVDAPTLRPVARLSGHGDDIADLELDPTGRRLYSASQDHRVFEWTLAADRRGSMLLAASVSAIDAVRPSLDGRTLVSVGDDGVLSVWDRERGRLVRAIEAHGSPIRGLGLLDDGHAITSGYDRTLRVHDLTTGESSPPVELPHFGDEIAIAPGRSTIAIGSGDGSVLLRDLETDTQTVVAGVHEGRTWWVGFDPTGRRLASAGFDGRVARIDPETGRVLSRWRAHDDRIYAAAWRPDGAELTTADAEGTVRAWDPETGARLREWRVLDGEAVHGLAWSSDGQRLLLTTSEGMRVLDADGALEARIDLGARTSAAAWTPDGRAVFASEGRIFVLPLDDDSWRRSPDALLRDAERAAGATVTTLIGAGGIGVGEIPTSAGPGLRGDP